MADPTSPYDAVIAARLADWAERDAEIGRTAEIAALEARNRKLEADAGYLMGRAATFEAELAELRAAQPVTPPASRPLPTRIWHQATKWWRARRGRT